MTDPNKNTFGDKQNDEMVNTLKQLQPRAPRLDWDAIRTASTTDAETQNERSTVVIAESIKNKPFAAWWSGLAAGVAAGIAVTYFAMQLTIVNELNSKIVQLQKDSSVAVSQVYTIETSPRTNSSWTSTKVADGSTADNMLSVGWYRTRAHRLVYSSAELETNDSPTATSQLGSSGSQETLTPSMIEKSDSQDNSSSMNNDAPVNRVLLQRELGRAIH